MYITLDVIFTILYFLDNLKMYQICSSVTLQESRKACRGKHSSLLDPFENKEEIEVL
jgi:hypothetical protein